LFQVLEDRTDNILWEGRGKIKMKRLKESSVISTGFFFDIQLYTSNRGFQERLITKPRKRAHYALHLRVFDTQEINPHTITDETKHKTFINRRKECVSIQKRIEKMVVESKRLVNVILYPIELYSLNRCDNAG